MIVRYMPNSDPWGPPGTSFMTIFVFYVNPQIPNIEYFEAYEIYKFPYEGISFFVSSNFLSNGVRIMSGDLFLTRVMSIFINVTILEKGKGKREGRKGREKGKGKREGKKGREKGKGKREGKKGREKGKGKREGKKGREKGQGKREGW